MLTVLHPQLLPTIQQVPGGLLPFDVPGEERPILVVKVPKEYILAAKINAEFKIYVTPVIIESQTTYGVVTAFFDDVDEPLTLKTLLFADDDFQQVLFAGLRHGEIDVHFFDELARERLVYRASVTIPDATLELIDSMNLFEASTPRARAIVDALDTCFAMRTEGDDAGAITVSLVESVYGELFIQDVRPQNHGYHGSRGFSHTILEREEPGNYQEEDIIQCLLMIFPADQIYFSPKRIYDKEEICDILVLTRSRVLIIQAKDSPNIERISRQKLSRKRTNAMHALEKAVEQVKGAIGYCRRNGDNLALLVDEEQRSIDINGLELSALIVVKELFNDQFKEYSRLMLGMVKNKNVPCVALDYPEFYKYCAHLESERGFFEAYDAVMSYAEQHGEYPRLRFV